MVKLQEGDTSTMSRAAIEALKSEPTIIEAQTYLPPCFHHSTVFSRSCEVSFKLIFMEYMQGTGNEWKILLDM